MSGASRVSEAELHAFVDGQLSDERALAVAVWLAEHPRDGLRVDGWRAQNDSIQRAFPTPARERVTLAFRAPESDAPMTLPETPAIEDYRLRRRRRHTLSLAAAFAIGALVAGAMALGVRRVAVHSASSEPVFAEVTTASDEFARRAVEAWQAYAQDVQHPVEMEARDTASLSRWIEDRTGLARLPVIADARLVGGRVLPGHGANAAFLLYRLASGDPVVLLAEPGARPASARPAGAFTTGGLLAKAWSRDGFDYALAGAVPERRLDSIATELGRPL